MCVCVCVCVRLPWEHSGKEQSMGSQIDTTQCLTINNIYIASLVAQW